MSKNMQPFRLFYRHARNKPQTFRHACYGGQRLSKKSERSICTLDNRWNKTTISQATSPTFRSFATVRTTPKEDQRDDLPIDAAIDAVNPQLSANSKILCALFDEHGKLLSPNKDLTKTQIAEQFDLRYRDLRDIDLRSESVTRILVRPATILLQFFDVCIIIQANESLLATAPSKNKSTTRETTLLTHAQAFETRLQQVRDPPDIPELPYELRAVEAALITILSALRSSLLTARSAAEKSAEELNLESGLAAAGLDLLFERARHLSHIETQARLVRETIRELLDTDEDLAAMYLTDTVVHGKPHAVSDHQEAEYMLEAYHKAADALVESASASIDAVRRKENTFRSALAVQRNQIMFLEARIAVHTLGLAAGTLVAGLFGMNLVSYAEEAQYGFVSVTAACVVLSACFSVYGARRLRRIQSLREIQGRKIVMGLGGEGRGTGEL